MGRRVNYISSSDGKSGSGGGRSIYLSLGGSGLFTSFTGTDGNDYVTGTLSDDYIETGAGRDTVNARDGNDTILSGPGNDTVYAGDGDDLIDYEGGGSGVYLDGGEGDDTINADYAAVTIFSGQGNDLIRCIVGNNKTRTIYLEGGSNTIEITGTAAAPASNTTIHGFQIGVDSFWFEGVAIDLLNLPSGFSWTVDFTTDNATLASDVGGTLFIFVDLATQLDGWNFDFDNNFGGSN